MNDSFDKFKKKIDTYGSKYANRPRRAAISLAWYGLKCAFGVRSSKKHAVSDQQLEDSKLKICFEIGGGIGDCLMAVNYIWHFKRFLNFEPVEIDVCVDGRVDAKIVFGVNGLVDKLYRKSECINVPVYDLCFRLGRLPEVCYSDTDKLNRLAPHVLPLLDVYQKFKAQNFKFYKMVPALDGLAAQLAIITGTKKIQQSDIGGLLKISADFQCDIAIAADATMVLTKFNLISGKFITLNRGVDGTNSHPESTKMWPLKHYDKLVELLGAKYPQYKIVQLGISEERCGLMKGVDVSLVGKTTMEEVKVLLKHAKLHIDGEGGLVHLRRALKGGKSVVLFGPTALEFYGYDDNINIKSDVCPHWCEWLANDWQARCLIDNNGHPCLHKLLPEVVVSKIVESNVLC